jgi:hypothetical protein
VALQEPPFLYRSVMSQPLDDARAKLSRANLHAEALRADIRDAGQGEPYTIPLAEDLDEDTGDLHLRVAYETARPERWGLLIGDALHNFRSALDNAWWQLAVRHLGREPTEKEAPKIQFPIKRPGGRWNPDHVRGWVGDNATKFAGDVQIDERGERAGVFHPLVELARLANIDKHRNIHLAVHVLDELRLGIRFVGKDRPTDEETPMSLPGVVFHQFGGRGPKAGDKLLTIPPESWLRKPNVEFDAHQSGFVTIDGKINVLEALDAFQDSVATLLEIMDHILEGRIFQENSFGVHEPGPRPAPPGSEVFVIPPGGGEAQGAG